MFRIYTVLLSILVGLVLAACSQPGTRTEAPTTSPPDVLVAYPAENAPEPTAIPETALDKTLPAGATGPRVDLRQVKPMPLPVHKEEPETKTPEREGGVIGFNLQTGEERRFPGPSLQALAAAPDSATMPGSPGVNEKTLGGTLEPQAFEGLSRVSDTSAWPASSNVKIFSKYLNGEWYACSGQLYSAKWVITAGHCIHKRTDGGYATQVVVVPGYEPDSSRDDHPSFEDFHDQPFGAAKAVWAYVYSGWRNDEDHDDDIGWIKLDRPVGILSGYEGWGYRTDCGFFKTELSNPFRQYSYPGAGPYNGEGMYYRSGDFDGCETNATGNWHGYEVRYDQTSYAGQSGSTFVRDGYIYAVFSNIVDNDDDGDGNPSDAVRLTAGKFNNMVKWIDDDMPATVDTVAMDVNTNRVYLSVGSTFDLDFLLYNYSKAAYNSHFGFYVYLSTNDLISGSDSRLGYFQPSNRITVNPGQTLRTGPASGSLKMPSCLPNGPGTYYLGVITNMFGGGDANTSNNDTSYNDAQEVYLSGKKCQ